MDMQPGMFAHSMLLDTKSRAYRHDDWDLDHYALKQLSDRNQRARAMWLAFDRVVDFVLQAIRTSRRATTEPAGA